MKLNVQRTNHREFVPPTCCLFLRNYQNKIPLIIHYFSLLNINYKSLHVLYVETNRFVPYFFHFLRGRNDRWLLTSWSDPLTPPRSFLSSNLYVIHTPSFCTISSFLPWTLPPHLCLNGQRPLSQPPQEMQRGQHGAQLAKVGQLELICERGGRDARQRAQAGQGACRHWRVRNLSRHHVRPGHHRRCGGDREEEEEEHVSLSTCLFIWQLSSLVITQAIHPWSSCTITPSDSYLDCIIVII